MADDKDLPGRLSRLADHMDLVAMSLAESRLAEAPYRAGELMGAAGMVRGWATHLDSVPLYKLLPRNR